MKHEKLDVIFENKRRRTRWKFANILYQTNKSDGQIWNRTHSSYTKEKRCEIFKRIFTISYLIFTKNKQQTREWRKKKNMIWIIFFIKWRRLTCLIAIIIWKGRKCMSKSLFLFWYFSFHRDDWSMKFLCRNFSRDCALHIHFPLLVWLLQIQKRPRIFFNIAVCWAHVWS